MVVCLNNLIKKIQISQMIFIQEVTLQNNYSVKLLGFPQVR